MGGGVSTSKSSAAKQKADELHDQAADEKELGDINMKFGDANWSSDMYDEALDYYERAAGHYASAAEYEAQADGYDALAAVLKAAGL